MQSLNPHDIPVECFYGNRIKNPLPTTFAGAIGGPSAPSYTPYPFATGEQAYSPYQPTPHRGQHAPFSPSYSPSQFVQPSLPSVSYGFPTAPQSMYTNSPSPLARRNSAVDNHHPRISDYSSLAGALDSAGPSRVRSNSIQKHGVASPYKRPPHSEPESSRSRGTKTRRGSKHIGPTLPDGPADHIRLPQEPYVEPIPESGYQRIDHHRLQPIMFKSKRSAMPGIRLREVDGESCPSLEGADDRVFEGAGYREIKIRILWPGYMPFEKRFKPADSRRSMVLFMTASIVTQYMTAINNKCIAAKRGYEEWSVGRRPNGAEGLRPEDVLITGIEHRGGANFQVEIWIPKRRMGIAY
ncbi:hypothetical protein FB45DRAFT_1076110 [Roridomyces roridus]|uniref:Uncharacterized protein n=1 Tax=Roridomyces roridus TaxID=1738132 RepID=A0AAD7FY91_9AGAR|nr:hypothetical protein FB45DRAFT_1076110 [Roridomyces roridus]